jgi:phosphohistidine phosphatase
MQLFLVHHGDAVPPDIDAQRPLSSAGQAAVARLAAAAAARGVRPAAIRHSGKLRARQTAEAFWRACNPLAEFAALRGLQPADPPERVRGHVAGETRDVILVGHMPNLARVLALLVTGEVEGGAEFPPHGLVALEPAGSRWIERWRLLSGSDPGRPPQGSDPVP